MGLDLTPQFVDDGLDWAGDQISSAAGVMAKTAEGAWDLATDPLEVIYEEARKGVALLKDKLGDIADFAANPVGDAATLRTAAATWRAVAAALASEGQSLNGGARGLSGSWQGPNSTAYIRGVTGFTASMGEVERTAQEIARSLDKGGDLIDTLNREVQELVIETLAWITFSFVLGLITGGSGLLLGIARVAAVVVKVRELIAATKSALLVLRVAGAIRLGTIGFSVRAAADTSRLARVALSGARAAADVAKGAKASKVAIAGLRDTKIGTVGKGAAKTIGVSTKAGRVRFASGAGSSAVSLSVAKDPRDWTTEDIARLVTAGVLTAKAGPAVSALLKRARAGGEVTQAAIQSALFGGAASAGTQAAFNGGKIDPVQVALSSLTGGAGGAIGRGAVRRRLGKVGTDELARERVKALGRGIEAIPEGMLQRDLRELRNGATSGAPQLDGRGVQGLDLRPDLPPRPKLYVIQPGESLWSIAGDRRDDPLWWTRIAKANPGLRNPDLIQPGDRLLIPAS